MKEQKHTGVPCPDCGVTMWWTEYTNHDIALAIERVEGSLAFAKHALRKIIYTIDTAEGDLTALRDRIGAHEGGPERDDSRPSFSEIYVSPFFSSNTYMVDRHKADAKADAEEVAGEETPGERKGRG